MELVAMCSPVVASYLNSGIVPWFLVKFAITRKTAYVRRRIDNARSVKTAG